MTTNSKTWGIGLGRTGTTSLCEALGILGYNRVVHNPTFEDLLTADAAADNGCIIYYKFVDYKYSGSKFVLTLRNMESWLESMKFLHSHIAKVTNKDNLPILRRMLIYETVDYDRDKYVEAYLRHHEDVRRYFRERPNDLLEINIIDGEGWEKLCPFLGLPTPSVPFPHSNTKRDLVSRFK